MLRLSPGASSSTKPSTAVAPSRDVDRRGCAGRSAPRSRAACRRARARTGPRRSGCRAPRTFAGRARGRQPAQLEHRAEVRADAQRERQLQRPAGVRAQLDALHERALVDELALDAQPDGLQLEERPVRQLEVGVRELVQQRGAGVGRADEQARRRAGDRQLVHGQVAAVVEVEPERVVAVAGQAAVALADEERVAELRDERLGEVEGGRGHGRRGGEPTPFACAGSRLRARARGRCSRRSRRRRATGGRRRRPPRPSPAPRRRT